MPFYRAAKLFLSSRAVAVALFAGSVCVLLAAQTPKQSDVKCKAGSKAASCNVQDATPPVPASDTAPATAVPFPFPTEDSKRGGATEPEIPATPNGVPAMPTGRTSDPPASSERPLNLPPGYTGSSSSGDDLPAVGGSSSSRTAEDDDIAPTTAAPDAPIRSSALKDLGSRGDSSAARLKLEQSRVSDDLKVGEFYMKDGNAQGAYLRFKDAADHAPDDPGIRFKLAEAANRLNKRDEAVLNYRQYLLLDSGGDHDKAARKALLNLQATAR